jgi:serine/threonine-protein kinase HipA
LLDQLYFFELTVFSFLTGNNDMHLKNFSMIHSGNDWILSPAYDLLNVLIVNPDDTEELALTMEGRKKKFKREHFERLGSGLSLNEKQINGVFRRLIQNKKKAMHG